MCRSLQLDNVNLTGRDFLPVFSPVKFTTRNTSRRLPTMKCSTALKFTMSMLLSAALLMIGHALAQESENPVAIDVTGDDRIAAATVESSRYHLFLRKQAKAAGVSAESPNVKFKSRTHPAL